MLLVILEKLGSVVTREAESHLGEVVGTEREELRNLRDLVGHESGAGNLDHRAYEVGERLALLLKYLGCGSVDDVGLVLDFLQRSYERNHDFGLHIDAAGLDGESGLDNRAGLHLGDFGGRAWG